MINGQFSERNYMGKIRVKTIGDETQEKEEQLKAKKKAEAKRAQEAAKKAADKTEASEETVAEKIEAKAEKDAEGTETKAEVKKKKAKSAAKFKKETKQKHSKQYLTVAAHVEKNKKYALSEAVALLPKLQRAKFDETVELHINTLEKGISGSVILPHGTGKTIRIAIANQSADAKAVEELVKKIEGGQIEFDVLIATPDTMPKLAKVARVLGPRGLMPNPKNGTVTPKPDEAAKKFEGGQMHFKTEAKFPLLHMTIGKVSFGDKKLAENAKASLHAVKSKNIRTVTLKSTMSPGIELDTNAL